MKAAILAGGMGKRLRPYTEQVPKPMVELSGKPIVEWQVRWLKHYGVDHCVILAGHMSEKLFSFLDSKKKELGVSFTYFAEKEPLGSGGALKQAQAEFMSEKKFLMLNGDIISNMDIGKLDVAGAIASMSLVPLKSPYGIVKLEGSRVTGFEEKPLLKQHLVNAGVYLLTPEVFSYLPANGYIEKSTFPELAKNGKLKGVNFETAHWWSVDTVKDMEEAAEFLSKNSMYSQV